jgi:hypothetical protein
MASLAIRKQVMAVAMCEGFVEMMWAQRYSLQENNKTFAGIRDRLQRDAAAAYAAIGNCGQRLSFEEWEDLKQNKVEKFKAHAFHEGFAAMDAVGFMVGLVTEQLSFCRQGTLKHAAFDRLLSRIRELERYFDRKRIYLEVVN